MIARPEKVESICCEPIEKIENYSKAIKDKKNPWELHHRLETEWGVSKQWLIEHDLYYNRPASELIFLTKSEHAKLHAKESNHPMWKSFDMDEIVRLYTEENMKASQIAEKFGTSVSVIYSKLKKAGVKMHTKCGSMVGKTKEAHPRYKKIDEELLFDMVFNQKMTVLGIARELGLSAPTVRKRIKELKKVH